MALGLPLALGAGRLLGQHLYGMSPNQPAVLFGAAALLGLAAFAAAWLPALRASALSPLDALRTE